MKHCSPASKLTLGLIRTNARRILPLLALAAPLVSAVASAPGSRLTSSEMLPAPAYDAGNRVPGRKDWALSDGRAETFRNLEEILPTRRVAPPPHASALREPTAPFKVTYSYGGATHTVADFVARTDTTALLVLKNDQILFEGYYQGADRQDLFMSFSSGKSVTSTLVGLAVSEGRIASIQDPIVRYLPELKGSAYEKARIIDVLQMSSGTSYTEEYTNPESDIAKFVDIYDSGTGGAYDFARSFKSARAPGEKFYYASADTLILGELIARVTGQSLSAYMSDKLWKPMGAQAAARWILDSAGSRGREMAMGGMQAQLRDYGRFGMLFANGGRMGDKQVVPRNWVEEATVPRAPHLEYGKLMPDYPLGYGYQWWCIPGPHHPFTAEGIHGQFVMVDPVEHLVMVKLSSWREAWDDAKDAETRAFFQAVADAYLRGADSR